MAISSKEIVSMSVKLTTFRKCMRLLGCSPYFYISRTECAHIVKKLYSKSDFNHLKDKEDV